MGKRYFCDYCDKNFPDNAQNRKKHMSGTQHQRRVKTHYYNFKDPEEILKEESAKRPCKNFFRNGYCEFHPICRFSHLSPQLEKELKQKIETKRQEQENARRLAEEKTRVVTESNPTLEGWMSTRNTLDRKSANVENDRPEDKSSEGDIFRLPPELRDRSDLPPSMVPPTLYDLVKAQDVDWG